MKYEICQEFLLPTVDAPDHSGVCQHLNDLSLNYEISTRHYHGLILILDKTNSSAVQQMMIYHQNSS